MKIIKTKVMKLPNKRPAFPMKN